MKESNRSWTRRLGYACALIVLSTLGAAQKPAPEVTSLEQSLTAEVDRFTEADRVLPPASCQVLFIGSSTIEGWKDTLAADMAPIPVINRGIGSAQIEFVNHWFDRIVHPYRPRAIVFYAADNDLDAGKPVGQVVSDFDTFMDLKTRKLGQTPVYFISVKPSKARIQQFPEQAEANAAVRRRAAERTDLHFIDIVPAMLDGGRPRDLFVSDGLHLNRQGYEIWAKVVRTALLPDTELEARNCRRGEKP